MKRIATIVVYLALIQPGWAGAADGAFAYARGDYATALREFKPLAEQGNATAQYDDLHAVETTETRET